MNDNRPTPSPGIVYGLLAVFGICLIGVFGLAALGRDIGQVIYFVTPNLVLIGGILAAMLKLDKVKERAEELDAKTDQQTEKLNQISGQVNGKLDAKFATLHDRIEALHNQVELSQMNMPPMDIDTDKGHNHD